MNEQQRLRLVVACDEGAGMDARISQHFGHCTGFLVVEVQDGEILGHETVPNPYAGKHRPGVLPVFVTEGLNASALFVGGLGEKAQTILTRRGVEVLAGLAGSARSRISAYLRGALVAPGSTCDHGKRPGACHGGGAGTH